MRVSFFSASVFVGAHLIFGCGSSFAGTVSGTCRLRWGGHDSVTGIGVDVVERTDPVSMHVTDTPGGVRIELSRGTNHCELSGAREPDEPDRNPSFVITSGTCTWDVPGAGVETFSVADMPAPHHTEGRARRAYATFSAIEIFLGFETHAAAQDLVVDCSATR